MLILLAMTRFLLVASSLLSAAGNYIFLFGLDEQTSYIFVLSFSSCLAGFYCYGFMPTLFEKVTAFHLCALTLAFLLLGSVPFHIGFGSYAVLVLATIFAFISTEMILARCGYWNKVYVLRLVMFITGLSSWIFPDLLSITLRFVGVLFFSLFCWALYVRSNIIDRVGRRSAWGFIALVCVNLSWVYLMPLLLVGALRENDQVFVYVISTVAPLIYFKGQDAIFKFDVVGDSSGSKSGGLVFLSYFAVPLVLLYLAFLPIGYFSVLDAPMASIMRFVFSSLFLLSLNVWLTYRLSFVR